MRILILGANDVTRYVFVVRFIDSAERRSKTIFGKDEIVLLDFVPFLDARAGRIPDGMRRL